MGTAAKWLVCSGAGEFLPIAGALVMAGCTEGIEWEPLPARAYSRMAAGSSAAPPNVVVGEGLGCEAPVDVACRLAGMTTGTSVLCSSQARAVAGQAMERGVTAAVEPAGLVRLLLQEELARAVGEGDGAPAGEHPVAQPIANVSPIVEDLEEPQVNDPFLISKSDGSPVGREQGEEPAVRSLRNTGAFPRADVPGDVLMGDFALTPDGGSVHAVGLATQDLPCRESLGFPLVKEPVVYRPVVNLPQRDCPVAGAEAHVPTVCITSPRGGVGRTSLAVLMAVALAREGLNVALIDLDFQFGTCFGYLGADTTDGLFDVGTPAERVRVDARSLARCRTTPESGLAAYEFCRAPEQAEVLAGMAGELLKAARAGADVAVVDLPAGVNEATAQVLDIADRCLFVADQRPLALESLASQQSLCARMGIARTKLATVMNRCDPRHRDEGFLSRVGFEVQTPQVMRVVDGGPDVAQMLSIGRAGELLTVRNRFALSAADLAHAVCADLGCQADASSQPARQPVLASAADSAPVREGFLKRRRREKHEEEVACPF